MRKKAYIETSIISYLSSRLSGDLVQAAHQKITEEWWQDRRTSYELFTSQFTIDEARTGNAEAANRRLVYLDGIPPLKITDDCLKLGKQFMEPNGPVPSKAQLDAFHIATATYHGIDILLTWNCKHIANGDIQADLRKIATESSFILPTICTPRELMGR